MASDFVDYSDPLERARARRNPARIAPTERAAPKATADGTALPLSSNPGNGLLTETGLPLKRKRSGYA